MHSPRTLFPRWGWLAAVVAVLIVALAFSTGPTTTVVAQIHDEPTATPTPIHDDHDATATPTPIHDDHEATATATPIHDDHEATATPTPIHEEPTATSTPIHEATATPTATPVHEATATPTATPVHTAGCTYTQGFYKNHDGSLPATMLLGSVSYSRAQLVTILTTPVRGNGAIALAYQLIAAQANIASGASAPASVQTAIQQANALLTGNLLTGFSLDTSATSGLTATLDQYNNGLAAGGPAHC